MVPMLSVLCPVERFRLDECTGGVELVNRTYVAGESKVQNQNAASV